jgi:hypothetical protein
MRRVFECILGKAVDSHLFPHCLFSVCDCVSWSRVVWKFCFDWYFFLLQPVKHQAEMQIIAIQIKAKTYCTKWMHNEEAMTANFIFKTTHWILNLNFKWKTCGDYILWVLKPFTLPVDGFYGISPYKFHTSCYDSSVQNRNYGFESYLVPQYMSTFSCVVLSCAGRGLAMGWLSIQVVIPNI